MKTVKSNMKSLVRCITVGVLALVLAGCASSATRVQENQTRYLKYNVHTQVDRANVQKGSYANYTNPGAGHVIIPAETKINITRKGRRGFFFTYGPASQEAFIEFHQGNMGMSMDAYIDLITSDAPVSLEKFSSIDRKGIAEGAALVGMSKEGVMAALGYPAAHRTPDLDASRWIYWQNRFRTLAVDFDSNGKVKSITQ